jgi:excisionase family DNA binding protein
MPTVSVTDGLLTLSGAAEYLQVSERALRDLCRSKAITHVRLDYRNYRFRLSELDAFLNSRTHRAKGVYSERTEVLPKIGIERSSTIFGFMMPMGIGPNPSSRATVLKCPPCGVTVHPQPGKHSIGSDVDRTWDAETSSRDEAFAVCNAAA